MVPRRPRTTKYVKAAGRSVGVLTRKKTTYTRKKYPARLSGSRANYNLAKQVSRIMNRVSENKLVPLLNSNEVAGVPIQVGALAYTKSFTLGTIPSVWSGITGLSSLSGMSFVAGTGHQQRIGRYIYLQKTHMTLELDMNVDESYMVPTEFRVICFKAKRGNNPSGITNRFDQTLFISPAGLDFGHNTSGINGTDLIVQPLNKKDWQIRFDKRFMLSNPAMANSSGSLQTAYSGKYPVMKRMTFDLPFYSKCEVDNVTTEPMDVDTNYVVVIYARTLAKDAFASKWEVSTRGTTTFKDN